MAAPARNPASHLVLLAACAIGLGRFMALGEWSLWYDEAVTYADGFHGSVSNPAGYWLVRTLVETFDSASPLLLRLPAAIFGWLCIPLTFWAFRGVAGDRRAAWAALLVAASSWALYWSQNARFYTAAQAIGLVGTGLCLRGLLGGRTWLALLGLGVTALGALFHPSAVFLAGGVAAGAVLGGFEGDSKKSARAILFAGIGAALLASPWAIGAIKQFMAAKDTGGIGSMVHLIKSTGFFVTPALGFAAVLGSLLALKEAGASRFLAIVPVVGLGLAVAAAPLAASSAQYVFVLLPLIALLGVWPLKGLGKLAAAGWNGMLAVTLLAGSLLYFTAHQGERPRWQEAYQYVWDHRAPDDLVLGMQAAVGEYYLSPGVTDLRGGTRVSSLDRTNLHVWKRWADRDRPMWLVVRPEFLQLWKPDERAQLTRFLREECRLERSFDVKISARDLDVEVWSRR